MMQNEQKWLQLALFFSVVVGVVSESIHLGSDEERNDASVQNVWTRRRSARKLKKSKNSKPSTCAITYEQFDEMQAIEDQVLSEYNILEDELSSQSIMGCIGSRFKVFTFCPIKPFSCMLAGLKTCELGFDAVCQIDWRNESENCAKHLFDARENCKCPSLLKP